MFVVDTNILVYAANADSPFHPRCREWLDARRERPDAWYVTWGILYEFLRVTTHRRVFRTPWRLADAWQFVACLLDAPGLAVLAPTDRHASVAARTIEEAPQLTGNLLHDAHTAILMREHGVRTIYTRDHDFRRFPFLEVIDPTELAVGDSRTRARPATTARRRRANRTV